MICGRRVRGETKWRCWSVECLGCRKTYRTVASQLVSDLLDDRPDLRTVWWLPVEKDHVDELTANWRRLYEILDYHDQKPETYIWFVTEAGESVAKYCITDQAIDSATLNRYWRNYPGGLDVDVF